MLQILPGYWALHFEQVIAVNVGSLVVKSCALKVLDCVVKLDVRASMWRGAVQYKLNQA